MKRNLLIVSLLLVGMFGTSCKSAFEKIRASGNPELIYKKAFEYFDNEDYQKAQTLFEAIIPHYRGKKELEKIYYSYAYTFYNLERYIMASYYFKNFAKTFPNSNFREEAEFMAAYSNYELSPTYRLDQTYTLKAIDDFQLFVNTFPQSDRVKECNKLIDELRAKLELKDFKAAELYYDLHQYQAATHSFENLLKDYPETTKAEEIRYLMAKAAYLLAKNSVYEKREERYNKALDYANLFLAKYKNSNKREEIVTSIKKSKQQLKKIENDRRHQVKSAGTGS